MELIILLSSLVLIAIGGYSIASIILTQNDDKNILAWAEGDEPPESGNGFIRFSLPLVRNFSLSHARKIKGPKYRKSIEKKLLTAGLNKEMTVDEFIGLQILWGMSFPVLFAILNLGLNFGFPHWSALIIAGIGIYFPHAYCNSNKKKRAISIRSELPLFVDILALSIEAGMDFIGAIQRITDKAPKKSVLSAELLIVLKDLKLGETRSKALSNLDKRVDMPEVKSVVLTIQDAGETGASIAETLKAKSKQMRFERFAKAEEAGAKASQKILIPMMIFIIPAVFIVIFAPAVFQFMGMQGGM